MEKSNDALLTTIKIKKETQDETIKEYAESAMNELLAWYGYGSAHENSKLSSSCHSQHGSNSSESESPKVLEECEWCGKHINDAKGLMSSKSTFCSELCFSQSRRANFKKNRTCDWCKHLRHTVSYVDFQDGASQLQFCSDKCLNQYKMHIFCRETRAHLELHPHIPDNSDLGGSLITPELWLKNCKSPEHTSSTPDSPRDVDTIEQNSPLPLISTTHHIKSENIQSTKRLKNKFPRKHRRSSSNLIQSSIRSSPISESPQDLRVRQTPLLNKFEPTHVQKEYRTNEYYNNKFPEDIQTRFTGISNGTPQRYPKFLPSTLANEPHIPYASKPSLENLMPPVTVLVPYPIIIPIPLPIPIPIPIFSNGLDILDKKPNKEATTASITKNTGEVTNIEKTSNDDVENTNENVECVVEDSRKLQKETIKNKDIPSRKKKCTASQKTELTSVKKKKFSSP